MLVLVTGMGFALGNVKPIPAIILAQALNGFLLPFVSIFLFIAINNRQITSHKTNSFGLNILMILVIFITLILGINSATKAIYTSLFPAFSPGNFNLLLISLLAIVISFFVWKKAIRKTT